MHIGPSSIPKNITSTLQLYEQISLHLTKQQKEKWVSPYLTHLHLFLSLRSYSQVEDETDPILSHGPLRFPTSNFLLPLFQFHPLHLSLSTRYSFPLISLSLVRMRIYFCFDVCVCSELNAVFFSMTTEDDFFSFLGVLIASENAALFSWFLSGGNGQSIVVLMGYMLFLLWSYCAYYVRILASCTWICVDNNEETWC